MKKSEIMQLVKSDSGTLEVNPLCTLRRWTVDPLGNRKVDWLELDFVAINKMGRFSGSVTISARDYSGIVAEIETAIKYRLERVAAYLCDSLRNGYTP